MTLVACVSQQSVPFECIHRSAEQMMMWSADIGVKLRLHWLPHGQSDQQKRERRTKVDYLSSTIESERWGVDYKCNLHNNQIQTSLSRINVNISHSHFWNPTWSILLLNSSHHRSRQPCLSPDHLLVFPCIWVTCSSAVNINRVWLFSN